MTRNDHQKQERRDRLNLISESYAAASQIFDPQLRTRVVKSLRVVLPSFALMVVAVLFLWPKTQDQGFNGLEPAAGNVIIEADYDVMNRPHYQAFDKKMQAYDVTADRARRQISNPALLELDTPNATIQFHNHSNMALRSQSGKYDQDANHLKLSGDVWIEDSRGYKLNTSEMLLDIEENTALSTTPVAGQNTKGSHISSEGMMLYNNEDRVIFTGRSKLILQQ